MFLVDERLEIHIDRDQHALGGRMGKTARSGTGEGRAFVRCLSMSRSNSAIKPKTPNKGLPDGVVVSIRLWVTDRRCVPPEFAKLTTPI
jgi:hypothetical protein